VANGRGHRPTGISSKKKGHLGKKKKEGENQAKGLRKFNRILQGVWDSKAVFAKKGP